jgi:hypothetical protein
MYEVKKYGYFSITVIFIITAITSVLEIIYIAGEYCFNTKLLPEPIWDFLDGYFYYEALPLRFLIVFAIVVVLSILLFAFYRKEISNITATLSSTAPIISAIGWTSHYWIADVTENAIVWYIIISTLCIIHIITTVVFLIKDINKIKI